MANKATLLAKAIELGLEVTEANTVPEIKEALATIDGGTEPKAKGLKVTSRAGSWNIAGGTLTLITISKDGVSSSHAVPISGSEVAVTLKL